MSCAVIDIAVLFLINAEYKSLFNFLWAIVIDASATELMKFGV